MGRNSVKKIIGYFPGTWDLFHTGHVLALEEARQYCDFLIIGLVENPQVGNSKKNVPVMTLEERYRILRGNKFADAILVYGTEYESKFIDNWLPYDIRFMGEDHKGKKHPHIKSKIIYISRKHNYSSTELRNRLKNV